MRSFVVFLFALFLTTPLTAKSEELTGTWEVDLSSAVRADCEEPDIGEGHLGVRSISVLQKGKLVRVIDRNISEVSQKMYGPKTRRGFSASTWFTNATDVSESDIIRTGASYKFILDNDGRTADVIFKLFYLSSTADNSQLVLANDCEYTGIATKLDE